MNSTVKLPLNSAGYMAQKVAVDVLVLILMEARAPPLFFSSAVSRNAVAVLELRCAHERAQPTRLFFSRDTVL